LYRIHLAMSRIQRLDFSGDRREKTKKHEENRKARKLADQSRMTGL